MSGTSGTDRAPIPPSSCPTTRSCRTTPRPTTPTTWHPSAASVPGRSPSGSTTAAHGGRWATVPAPTTSWSYTSSQGGLGFNTVAVLLWPRTSVTVISLGGSLSISNYSYYGTYEVDFSGSNSWIRNAAVAFVSSALGPISTTPIDLQRYSPVLRERSGDQVSRSGQHSRGWGPGSRDRAR